MNIGGIVNKAIYVIIGVVLLFSLYSTLMPTAQIFKRKTSFKKCILQATRLMRQAFH